MFPKNMLGVKRLGINQCSRARNGLYRSKMLLSTFTKKDWYEVTPKQETFDVNIMPIDTEAGWQK